MLNSPPTLPATSPWRQRLLAWMLPLLLAACGGGAGDEPPAATPAPAPSGEATVGSAGGSLAHADGVKLTLPAGAMATTQTLRIARDTTGMNAALLGVAPDASKSVDLSPTYALTPHGTRFAEPVELRIPLDAAAAAGPGTLAVLRTEPGQATWQLMPVAKVEGGAAVVAIDGFSYYKVVRLVQMPQGTPNGPPAPFLIDMAASFDGVGPETFTIPSTTFPNNQHRRLYGEITSRNQTLRYTGRIVGLPASCANITLNGQARFPKSARAEDANGGTLGTGYAQEPAFAQATAVSGSTTVNGRSYPTLDFAFDLNMANAPYQRSVFEALRAANNTGPTPTVAVSFNAWASCTHPVDMGGGNLIGTWKVAPGVEKVHDAAFNLDFIDDKGWVWNTVQYKVDYLPQGFISHPADVSVATGAAASFSTSAWPTPVGEQRIEWWRSNNDGASWARVRTALVPVADTADTYTLPAAAASDHNALFRARLCTVPRQANVAEACNDGLPARLTVVQGVAAASFTQQPRALLVRSGQTASLGVQVIGTPAPTLRWQSRPANSSGAWADVATGTGAGTANYTTAALSLADNGLQLRVLASNAAGDVASQAVTVSVSDADVAPSLVVQPAPLAVVAGSEAVFAVTARGTEALSYQWRRNGTPIAGAQAPVLKLAAVTVSDASVYSVQVSNAAGSVESAGATLSVSAGAPAAVAPSITTQPAAVSVGTGNTATFAVGVAGTGPFSFQWRKDGTPIAGATAAAFTISAAAAGDEGTYSVLVTNSAGSATSSGATLSISVPVVPVVTAPQISTQPATQVGLPGGSATFAVAASGTAPLAYQWARNGTPIAGATGPVLNIGALNGSDAGEYTVAVSNAAGSVASNAGTLIVVGAPAISTSPASISVVEGSTARFSVAASGSALRYLWLRDGLPIAGATEASTTTAALTLADSGAAYSVIVYNGAGVVLSEVAVLTVTAAPVASPVQSLGKIAMAYQHSCAITATDAVACWGYNSSGQIGRGDTINQPMPFVWNLPEAAVQVAAGAIGSCAVTVSGQVWCSGAPTNSRVPTRLAGFSGVRQVTLGSAHACLLQGDGTVWCWGNNSAHQFGNGGTAGSATPVQVQDSTGSALTGVLGIDAGDNHTCAMLDDNGVRCWGVNEFSQSGRDSSVITSRATAVPGASYADHIAAGANFTCLYSGEGRSVMCWGLALDGSNTVSPSPQESGPVAPAAVGAGSAMACAIDDSANVWCWGTGVMGNGNVNQTQAVPTKVSGLSGAVAVAGGLGHTCVLRSTGALVCWGSNGSYQLGTGDPVARTTPTEVPLAGGFWRR